MNNKFNIRDRINILPLNYLIKYFNHNSGSFICFKKNDIMYFKFFKYLIYFNILIISLVKYSPPNILEVLLILPFNSFLSGSSWHRNAFVKNNRSIMILSTQKNRPFMFFNFMFFYVFMFFTTQH